MTALRIVLVAIFATILIYTVQVIAAEGWNLMPVFFGDIAAMRWPGQFNLDFLCMLTLSALWLAWRHGFTATAWLIGLAGLFGGAFFLSGYLLVASRRARDPIALLLGPVRDPR